MTIYLNYVTTDIIAALIGLVWVWRETDRRIVVVRAWVREVRHRREQRVLNDVFAEYDIGYRVGAAPKGAET